MHHRKASHSTAAVLRVRFHHLQKRVYVDSRNLEALIKNMEGMKAVEDKPLAILKPES